jgi:hypothetical protein
MSRQDFMASWPNVKGHALLKFNNFFQLNYQRASQFNGDNGFALGKKQKPLYEKFQLSPAINPEI